MGVSRGLPHLEKGPVPLRELRDHARSTVFEALDMVRGRKALVLEAEFAGPLGLIVEASALREHGVEIFGVLDGAPQLVQQLAGQGVRQVAYIVHTGMPAIFSAVRHVSYCKQVPSCDAWHWEVEQRPEHVFIIHSTANITADVSLHTLAMHWIPLEEDVLSLELSGTLRALTADGDVSCLWDVAAGLDQIQARYGAIPRIKAKGKAAVEVAGLLGRMRHAHGADAPSLGGGPDMLIILDRSVDIITPSCMQFTYEGLLDELLGMRCGQLQLGSEGRKVYGLNSSDAVFQETRGKIYQDARKSINDTLREIQQFRDQKMRTAEIPALHSFVADLREKFERLRVHTELVDAIASRLQHTILSTRASIEAGLLNAEDHVGAIQDLIHCEDDPIAVLRLLCLCSAVHGGLPRRTFDSVRRDFLSTYGHQHLLTLSTLQRAGLLHQRESKRSGYATVNSALRLMSASDEPEATPSDIHYVYAGYAPLSVRIIQSAVSDGGWQAQQSALECLPGPSLELVQTVSPEGRPTQHTDRSSQGLQGNQKSSDERGTTTSIYNAESSSSEINQVVSSNSTSKPVALVVFIGGVTSAEVAALRFLSEHNLVPCKFVVATTGIVTGRSLMQELIAS